LSVEIAELAQKMKNEILVMFEVKLRIFQIDGK